MEPRSAALSFRTRAWLYATLLVALALRVYLLAGQSLWNDEGTSVALAGRSIAAIVDGAAKDIHPPLYYLLLHFWMPLAGNSEFAVRFLSVVAGVLVVAVTWRCARYIFDEPAAIAVAWLVTFSPLQVEYSQETRMYMAVTLFAAVSVYAMTQMLRRGPSASGVGPDSQPAGEGAPVRAGGTRRRRTAAWFLYIAASLAALYTHYFAPTVLLAENIGFAVWLFLAWRDRRPGLAHSLLFWVAAQGVVGLAFVPWLIFAGGQIATWPAVSEPFGLLALVWRTVSDMSVGQTLDRASALPIVVAFGGLCLIGLWPGRGATKSWGTSLLASWMLVPIAVTYVVSLSRPAYFAKFMLLATPPFYVLTAHGLVRIYPGIVQRLARSPIGWKTIGLFLIPLAALAGIAAFPSLRNYYFDPRYARDDYRSIIRSVDASERPGDGILIDAPGQIDVFRYYHRGSQPVFALPLLRPPPPVATRQDVQNMLSHLRRLFAIYYATDQSDPQGIVETYLAESAYKASDAWYGDVRLAIYGIAASPGAAEPQGMRLGGEISLEDVRLAARDLSAGDIVALTMDWRADSVPSGRYKVFVHLLDRHGRVVAQRDGEPVADTRITTTWRVGEVVADRYGVLIPAATPPGEYEIEVGMYRIDTGERLPVADTDGRPLGDHLILGSVHVSE